MKAFFAAGLWVFMLISFSSFADIPNLGLKAYADETRTARITFAPGKSARTVKGSITGYDSIEYSVGASAGQRMSVTMRTTNSSSYFNVSYAGQSLFIGSREGNRFDGILPANGEYKVVVYLMRNAARRMETANFTLSVSGGRPVATRPQPDFADSLAGGADMWIVQGVPRGDTLNVRSKPSASGAVLAAFPNGVTLRNRGCRMTGSQRWCQIELPNGGVRGWVNGKFLREY